MTVAPTHAPPIVKKSIENVISEIQTGLALLLTIFGDDERMKGKQLLAIQR